MAALGAKQTLLGTGPNVRFPPVADLSCYADCVRTSRNKYLATAWPMRVNGQRGMVKFHTADIELDAEAPRPQPSKLIRTPAKLALPQTAQARPKALQG